ncbi:hypothetical protein TrVE_jg938 [Triparma verrucosa]|uniref:DUF6824 domain-containing protein n=1 Tax=Triparma verrucosa TaxID=1606542 RepID=A0A9W7FG27_9STRA|nr:hypothetical protein TrVE_jg938 [Triparma verrucosa]
MSNSFKPAIPEFTPQGHQISPTNVPFQITSITRPSQNDILMGRGRGANNHAGNLNYRKIIEQFKPVYSKSPKNGKLQYSCKVVDIVRSLNPPGRFLKKDAATGLFYDIGEKAAREKAGTDFRFACYYMGLVQETAKKNGGETYSEPQADNWPQPWAPSPTLPQALLNTCECGKTYSSRSGLWKHRKKCKLLIATVKETEAPAPAPAAPAAPVQKVADEEKKVGAHPVMMV